MSAFLSVKGKSMYPYFLDEDVLRYDGRADPEAGDIVVVRATAEKSLFVHRYLGNESGTKLVKGDRNLSFDQQVYPDLEIIGVVRERILGFGSCVIQNNFMKDLQTRLCVLNHEKQNWLLRKICVLGLLLIGWTSRLYECHFLKKEKLHGTL